MPKWTLEQERAMTLEGNLIVSAGAGSGKTAVLTERIVRLVRKGAAITDFLCLTFTNAAAAEMKKRVAAALARAAQESADEGEASRLALAARRAGAASISTFHHFCAEALRRHFNEAGIDPAFRVIDEAEAALLREEAWDGVCEEAYARGDAAFEAMMRAMGRGENAWDAVEELYDFSRSQIDSDAWLFRCADRYTMDADALERSWEAEYLMTRDMRRLEYGIKRLGAARDEVAIAYPALAAFLDGELALARAVLLHKSIDWLNRSLGAATAPGPRINLRKVDDESAALVRAARDSLKKDLKKFASAWARTAEEEAGRLHRQAAHIRALAELTAAFAARFGEFKAARGALDYDDLQHMALALVEGRTAEEYRARYKYIFVDEYQDSNAVQERIVARIAREGSLFLVGDVKQSIYRFRLAEPAIFMERAERYGRREGGERIDLTANFRSDPAVICAVNSVFERIMSRETAEIDYDATARLVAGRPGDGAGVRAELCFSDMLAGALGDEEDGGDDDDAFGAPAAEIEASIAVKRIRALMADCPVPDGAGGTRPAKYSDFAVLLRTCQGVAAVWADVLTFAGIPAYANAAGGYFDAVEVRVFLDLLRTIDNRRQDIPLGAVLRSPIGGFDITELIALRTDYSPRNEKGERPALVDALAAAAEKDGGTLGEKAGRILASLDRWRREAKLRSAESLIGMLLDETGYLDFCRCLPGGRQRAANLEALCARARALCEGGSLGIGDLLMRLDRLKVAGREGAAETAGSDVVRIMSIHSSKGLEFPVVIMGGLGKGLNRTVRRERLVMDADMGVGLKSLDGPLQSGSLVQRAIVERSVEKSTAEEMRILYVAMTRARERLIMVAAVKDGASAVSAAATEQDPSTLTGEKVGFLHWILTPVLLGSDGDPLRARYGLDPSPGGKSAGIGVKLFSAVGASLDERRMGEADFAGFVRRAGAKAGGTAPGAEFISWRYPYAMDANVPSKVSVTGLSREERTLGGAPDFVPGARLTAAQRGTATHSLMQLITLAPHSAASVSAEAKALAERGLLSEAEAEAVDAAAVAAFFASPLGKRLIAAKQVRREAQFNLLVPAQELFGGESSAKVLLQGVIDCCFVEDGEWILIDYKTDRVPPVETARSVAARHSRQLSLYARAVRSLTGMRVRQKYIMLLSVNESVEIPE